MSATANPVALNSLLCIVAQETLVTLSDGFSYQGVFSGTEESDGQVSLVLRNARLVTGEEEKIGIVSSRICLPVKNVVHMNAAQFPARPRRSSVRKTVHAADSNETKDMGGSGAFNEVPKAKKHTASSKKKAVEGKESPASLEKNTSVEGVPLRLRIARKEKMTYAAALGSKLVKPCPARSSVSPSRPSDAVMSIASRPPSSPVSPAESAPEARGVKALPANKLTVPPGFEAPDSVTSESTTGSLRELQTKVGDNMDAVSTEKAHHGSSGVSSAAASPEKQQMANEYPSKTVGAVAKRTDDGNYPGNQTESAETSNWRKAQLNPNAEEWHPKTTAASCHAHMMAFGKPPPSDAHVLVGMHSHFQPHSNFAPQFFGNVDYQHVHEYCNPMVPVQFYSPGMMHHQLYQQQQIPAILPFAISPGHGNFYGMRTQFMEQGVTNRLLSPHPPVPLADMGSRLQFHASHTHYTHWTHRTNFIEAQRYFPGPYPMYRLDGIPSYTAHHAH